MQEVQNAGGAKTVQRCSTSSGAALPAVQEVQNAHSTLLERSTLSSASLFILFCSTDCCYRTISLQ